MKVLRNEKDILELKHGDKILVYHKINKRLVLCNVNLGGGALALTMQNKLSMTIARSKKHMIERMSNNCCICAGFYTEL